MIYTCQPTGNSLDELVIPKNYYFEPSHVSVASFCLISEGELLSSSLLAETSSKRTLVHSDTGLVGTMFYPRYAESSQRNTLMYKYIVGI